jgi:hypothetical protein
VPDPSRLEMRRLAEASPEVLGDASRAAKRDASPLAGADASHPDGPDGSRRCAWCKGPIPAAMRRDAECCGQRCRQARHRFGRAVAVGEAADHPLRLAYADPPYPGLSGYYVGHPDYAGEVDHAALVSRLQAFDGWALSTSSDPVNLRAILSIVPPGTRIASWLRGGRPGTSGRPRVSWEPVFYCPARADTRDDWPEDALAFRARPRLTDPARVIGSKPAAFAAWIFALLGARTCDTLADLYPGSGGIGRAWALFQGCPF